MKHWIAAFAFVVSGAAFAHNCPNEMKAIDAELAKPPVLPATQIDEVRRLRADGERLHKEGKHDESMAVLAQAKRMLGL
mgnify:CR=1 FL=1